MLLWGVVDTVRLGHVLLAKSPVIRPVLVRHGLYLDVHVAVKLGHVLFAVYLDTGGLLETNRSAESAKLD